MLRKLLLSPWFGPLPPWMPRYEAQLARLSTHGFDVVVPRDLEDFNRRCQVFLEIESSVTESSAKIHDYRPALAAIYPELVQGYDFWGHTDLDCVYGRVEKFWPDVLLSTVDAASDHSHYLCGPWALYRPSLADAFMADPDWQARLEDPAVSGWVETDFTKLVGGVARVAYRQTHGYLRAKDCWWKPPDGALMEGPVERSFFHFKRTKEWPKGLQ